MLSLSVIKVAKFSQTKNFSVMLLLSVIKVAKFSQTDTLNFTICLANVACEYLNKICEMTNLLSFFCICLFITYLIKRFYEKKIYIL